MSGGTLANLAGDAGWRVRDCLAGVALKPSVRKQPFFAVFNAKCSAQPIRLGRLAPFALPTRSLGTHSC